MEIEELLKNSIITCIELHSACIILLISFYINMRNSYIRNNRKQELSLNIVYIGSGIMLVSDCIWTVITTVGNVNNILAYVFNLMYFFSSSIAAVCWFIFCMSCLYSKYRNNIRLIFLSVTPYFILNILYILSPIYGFIFYIIDGEYIRGSIFYLDPIIKGGYIVLTSVIAVICGLKKEIEYQRKADFNYAIFGVPVIICGILQTLTGVDFNCIGVTFGIVLIYIIGITNLDSENADAIYSLANSFEASYIVNMETGLIRPLCQDKMHDMDMPGMNSMDFTSHFTSVLSEIILPEDRESTLDLYHLENVAKRFKIDNAFSIRYRVKEQSGQTEIHTASFIRAFGNHGKNEFLLGINSVHLDSLLYERNERLSHENQRLEQINTTIIESVAKIVEVRDKGSGDHIVRVKKLTEIIARGVMKDYPEFNLDDEKVRLITSASVLHDVGKIVIPDAILLKPGRLNKEEFEVMKTHSSKGCDILNLFPLGLDDAFLEYALSICRWHHEKYDGMGYPDGLKGEEIPISAQIVSAADCFEALVSNRPYKEAYSPEKAFEMILNGECGTFSPKIISSMSKQKNKLIEFVRLHA